MNFRELTLHYVQEIPKGKVATYGQIAALISSPRAARAVGGVLRSLTTNEGDIPWWRVVNRKGYISINQGMGGVEKKIQRDYLLEEGLEIDDQYIVDMEKHLWVPAHVV